MTRVDDTFTLFISLVIEAFPFLLMGVLLSSALLVFVDEGQLIKRLPKHPVFGSLAGSCIGFMFPVCECGNVPVARRLLLQRMPISVAIGFLLAAPTINPIVIWSTWVAFRDQPELVGFRVLFSLMVAVVVACIFSVQKDSTVLLQPTLAKQMKYYAKESRPRATSASSGSNLLESGNFLLNQGQAVPLETIPQTTTAQASSGLSQRRFKPFLDNVTQELRELGGILVLGSAIAASIQSFTPRDVILSLGESPLTSITVMMIIGGLISICSTVDAFFALSFSASFTSSSLLAFLVFGPMIDLKSVGLLLSIFKARMVFYLFAIAAQLIFLLSLSHSYIIG